MVLLKSFFGTMASIWEPCCCVCQVFDVMIHCLLEQPPVQKMLDAILEHIGCLYKFHGESSVPQGYQLVY